MKKVIIIMVLLFNQSIIAQEGEMLSKLEVKESAISAVENYLLKYMENNIYNKYFEFNLSESYAIFALPFSDFKSDSISADLVQGFKVEVYFKNDFLNRSNSFFLTKELEIVENKDFNGANYTEQYVNSQKDFASKIEAKSILSPKQILEYVVKKYPDVDWSNPEITSDSLPPYNFYYEVLEKKCNPCKELHLAVDSLEIIGGTEVEMISN